MGFGTLKPVKLRGTGQGTEKNNFRIVSINDAARAAILDEDGGIVRYFDHTEVKLDPAAANEVAKCDQPVTINVGPHTPIFSK